MKLRPLRAFLLAPLAAPAMSLVVAIGVMVAQGEAADLVQRTPWLLLGALAAAGGISAYVVALLAGIPVYCILRRWHRLRPIPIIGVATLLGVVGLSLFWHLLVGATHAAWGPFLLAGTGAASGAAAGWVFWHALMQSK
jgi:hypothetical protein